MNKRLQTILRNFPIFWRYAFAGMLVQCCFLSILCAKDSIAQNVYSVPFELTAKDKTLHEIFAFIETETEYSFTYSSRKIDLSQRITVEVRESNLGRVLEIIAQEASLDFRQVNTIIMVRADAKNLKTYGTITGRVWDEQLNESLPGASIRIVNTTIGTSSDINGEYSLRVPEGDVEVEVLYIGFRSARQTVHVPANGVVSLEFNMISDVKELQDVVVSGVLQGQQRALNQQKSADNIKNIVSADQIGRFPDPNVAEALQRVPAVNIERDQGEGRYVLVRGLAPQFTNISINGEQIPSPEAGVRFVALDAIPADQLASIEVAKALTPDMDGDAIGGSVNLVTRTANSEKTNVSASALMGYNRIVGRTNLQGSLELSKRLLKNKLGVMLNASYYESDRGSDNWERDDRDMELRDYELVRTRLGLSSTIDYKFNERHEVYLRSIYNQFTDREQRRRYVFVPDVDNSPFEDAEIERLTKDRLEKQMVSSFNLGGKHFFSKFNLDYEVAYAKAVQDTPFDIEVATVGAFDDVVVDFNSNPKFPSFTVNGINHSDSNNPYLNNANYEFDEFTSGRTYANDVNRTAKFNLGIPYKIGSNDALMKFGAKARLKEKSFDITENVFGWAGGDVLFPGFDAGDYTLEKFSGGNAGKFLKGKYEIRPNVEVDKVINHFNANRNSYELDIDGKLATEAVEAYTAKEDVYAGYAMTKIQMKKLMILGGVRFEKTNVSYKSREVYYDFEGDLDEIVDVEGSTDYNFILPQLHLKYQIDNNTNLRFAATRSYARPNFEDIVPAQEIDLNAREGSVGNPSLKPVTATNIDLLIERYFGTVGIISGGVFYKRLDDFIFNRRFVTSAYNGRDFGIPIQLNQRLNGESANLIGFEAAYQQNLTFLPGALKNLSVYANYTFTNSSASIQSRDDNAATEKIRLPGQAKHMGNFSLAYDLGRLNLRVSSNFNGEYISEIGGNSNEDLYVKDRIQLDASATATLSSRLRLFAEFLNITNQPFQVYQGDKNSYVQREFYSWWTRVGLKFDL